MNLSMMVGGNDQLEFFLAPPINSIEALSNVSRNTPVSLAMCAVIFLGYNLWVLVPIRLWLIVVGHLLCCAGFWVIG